MTITEYIKKLQVEHKNVGEKITSLKSLQEKFPDLHRVETRWYKERLCSHEVNAIADKAYVYHSCGCCSDAPLMVSPHIIVNGMEIFSEPYEICVGEKAGYRGYGDIADPEWELRLKEHNLSEKILNIVRRHFDENLLIEDDDASSD